MKPFTIFPIIFFLFLATAISLSSATRSQPKDQYHDTSKGRDGGLFGPGNGSNIPGFGNGWGGGGGGYGAGYGGPSGGYSKGGIVRSTVECREKGPCYKKKLTCPAKCFYSYSRSGKNFSAGGGGGGCTIDCTKTCTAYC